uniref:Peroxisomal 2,4-dienoyl-CoA reductase [(3E)-enoyl-CoA-producing] n=1 Tax=Esox lucius TaxID=8010 RepID=A0A6Q2XBK9_ESOLU
MAEPQWAGNMPEDVDTDDCMTSYTHIYSPDLLKDQVAFITGGGSGIGLRVAEVLMRHGCDTVIASRNLERLTEAAKKLTAATGRHCLPLATDVRQPQTISAAVDETLWVPFHPSHCSVLATKRRWPTACCSWPAAPPPM